MPMQIGMLLKAQSNQDFAFQKLGRRNLIPASTKIHPPIFGHFHATTVAMNATSATSPCMRESIHPKSGPIPSRINMERNMTIKPESTLGMHQRIVRMHAA